MSASVVRSHNVKPVHSSRENLAFARPTRRAFYCRGNSSFRQAPTRKDLKLDRTRNANQSECEPPVDLPYARGRLLRNTADDITKLQAAWSVIATRIESGGRQRLYNFSGLDRAIHLRPDDLDYLDDEIAPALYGQKMVAAGIEHLGGRRPIHDVAITNRVTAGIVATALTLLRFGQTVVGVSANYSHPCIRRAVLRAGAKFFDNHGLEAFRTCIAQIGPVSMVVITRLSVSYEIMDAADIRAAIELARSAGALVLLDDAGGARVGPAVFDQPRSLEFDVDIAVTGLDKYGTTGPRVGLLGGRAHLVSAIRACAFELGLECRPMLYPAVLRSLQAYAPDRVRAMVNATKAVGDALEKLLGSYLFRSPVSVQLPGEAILDMILQRSGTNAPPIVPYEATAALAMLLLRRHGILTVHFAGLPPGTSALLLKFLEPNAVARFGGPEAVAGAIDNCLDELAEMISDTGRLRALLLEAPPPAQGA